MSFEKQINVQEQISERLFEANGGYCVYHPSNFFRNTRGFENWRISVGYFPVFFSQVTCLD